MQVHIRKTGWGRHLLYGAGLLALLLLLTPGGAGAVDLVVDGGATQFVPPSITFDNEIIGDTGQGTLTHFAGSNTVNNDLTLGKTTTGNGTYNLWPFGTLSVGRDEFIGNQGTGTFIQVGGSHTVSNLLMIGNQTGSSGTYHLKFGTLAVAQEGIGNFPGGTGTFIQAGGSHTVSKLLSIGNFDGSSGTYQLKFGTLAVADFETIGNLGGTGTFIQAGGSHTVSNWLTLGNFEGSSGTYHLKFGTLAVGTNENIGNFGTGVFNQSGGQHTVANILTLAPLVAQPGSSGGTYNLSGGKLSAGTIQINAPSGGGAGGTFNVLNTITTVTGDVVNFGTVKTTNAVVTWNGNFTNNGAYISDPATQIFTDLNVNGKGFLMAASQDVFKIKNDFNNMSTNTTAWNTAAATLQFITGADKGHNYYIPGADNGASGTNEFAWHTLNILGQTVHLLDGNTGNTGTAEYVKVLLGAQVNYATKIVNNIFNEDSSKINIYYDPTLLANFYLLGLDYTFANGAGMLIADGPGAAPLPPSVFLLGSGLLGMGLLGWRKRRLMS